MSLLLPDLVKFYDVLSLLCSVERMSGTSHGVSTRNDDGDGDSDDDGDDDDDDDDETRAKLRYVL